jgi:hypothetical protein
MTGQAALLSKALSQAKKSHFYLSDALRLPLSIYVVA